MTRARINLLTLISKLTLLEVNIIKYCILKCQNVLHSCINEIRRDIIVKHHNYHYFSIIIAHTNEESINFEIQRNHYKVREDMTNCYNKSVTPASYFNFPLAV